MILRSLLLSLVLLLLAAPLLRADEAKPSSTATTPAEAKLGAETAKQIEQQFKLVKDDATVAKLEAIANTIAPFSQRPDVKYTCKILDTPALNAMAIPGGTIYVTKGLLGAVESDHELAGVLAHEIAHNALYHAKVMMEREKNAGIIQMLTLLAAIYSSRDSDVGAGDLITMSQLVKEALMNGYSVELETQADLNGAEYLYKSKQYNPVGLYSVILGFKQIEDHQPKIEYGYLKTHPYAVERKTNLEQKFKELHIPINLWAVVNFRATLLAPPEGQPGQILKLGTVPLFTYQAADGGQDAKARAQEAADAINRRLVKYPIQQIDVDVDCYGGNGYVRLRGLPVITLTPQDATAVGLTVQSLGDRLVDNIRQAIRDEQVRRS